MQSNLRHLFAILSTLVRYIVAFNAARHAHCEQGVRGLTTTEEPNMRIICCLALVASLLTVLQAFAEDEPAKKPSVWMRTKLEHSQKVLGALATEDYEAIADSAKAMNNLSELEKHVRAGTPGYRTQLQIFRYANEDLLKQAKKKNIDGCALAFSQLTLSCVNCHKSLRDKD